MRCTFATCTIIAIGTTASADIITFTGNSSTSTENSGAMFMASLDYTYDGADIGTLSVSIANSSVDIGGFLTGFVFNIDSIDDGATANLMFGSNTNFLNTGSTFANPFGLFDAGAALNANWLGGGSPLFGLASGDSGSFDFQITATDADLLTASSFLNDTEFAVRFRGLDNGGSDKILAPTPGTGMLAMIAMGWAGRRRR